MAIGPIGKGAEVCRRMVGRKPHAAGAAELSRKVPSSSRPTAPRPWLMADAS